jgi:hypothetical protein
MYRPKRQAAKARLGFSELANGFAGCEDPPWPQRICDQLGPAHIQILFERWLRAVPRSRHNRGAAQCPVSFVKCHNWSLCGHLTRAGFFVAGQGPRSGGLTTTNQPQ